MAKDKEKKFNPVQQQHKADKARQLKKSKAQQTAQRNEKLARRNPERLQRQIDDLKALESSGSLRPKDKQTLEGLEKDLRAVQKAREALGEKAPTFRSHDGDREGFRGGRGGRGGGVLGKRRREGQEESECETDEDARDIPMPKDVENLPPVPRRNRPRHAHATGANAEAMEGERDLTLPPKPIQVAQTVYEAAPIHRNLQKEATKFIPAAVAAKLKAAKGQGKLLEPEEADQLEKQGYGAGGTGNATRKLKEAGLRDAEKIAEEMEKEAEFRMMNVEGGEEVEAGLRVLEEEERRFEREMRRVEIEEVEDEGL